MFMRYLHKNHKRMYLLVESEEDGQEAFRYMQRTYSGIQLVGLAKVSAEGRADDMLVNAINGSEVDCILSALSVPLQEDFIAKNRNLLDARVWVGAIVQILQYLSKEESLKAFVIWTMGALGDVTSGQLLILVPSVFAGLLLAVLTIKPLNLLLFGEEYAVTMGLNIRRSRSLLFLSTTLLAGTITAFCGPIGFIGLAMPHVTRMLFQNSDHHVLLPGTILSGASILLLCDIISKIFTLPINAITALLGIPIVVWVVLRNKSITA